MNLLRVIWHHLTWDGWGEIGEPPASIQYLQLTLLPAAPGAVPEDDSAPTALSR